MPVVNLLSYGSFSYLFQANQQITLSPDARGTYSLSGKQFPSIEALVEHFMGTGESLEISGRCVRSVFMCVNACMCMSMATLLPPQSSHCHLSSVA